MCLLFCRNALGGLCAGGSSIVISGVGDKKPGIKAAVKLGRKIWNRRKEFKFQGTAMEPLEALITLDRCNHYPAFLSDSADNVTAGAAGDNAYMLDLILKQGIKKEFLLPILSTALLWRSAPQRRRGTV